MCEFFLSFPQVTKTLFIIILAFNVCWLPYAVGFPFLVSPSHLHQIKIFQSCA